MLVPGRRLRVGEGVQIPHVGHALGPQPRADRIPVREMLEGLQPDCAPCQIARGPGGIGMLHHVAEFGHAGAGREHHPWPARELAHLLVERLHLVGAFPAKRRHALRRYGALQLEDVDAVFLRREGPDAFEHVIRVLRRHLDIVGRLVRLARQRVDEQLEKIGNIVLPAVIADPAGEILLLHPHRGAGVRPVPGKHLHRVAAAALDLLDRPIVDFRRKPAALRLLEDRILERDDQALGRRQQAEALRKGEMGVEQHRRAFGLQLLDQHQLETGDILVRRLRQAALLLDRVLDRRALVHRRHLEQAGRIGHAAHAPELAGGERRGLGPGRRLFLGHYSFSLRKVSTSALLGIPSRPPNRVHLRAATALA